MGENNNKRKLFKIIKAKITVIAQLVRHQLTISTFYVLVSHWWQKFLVNNDIRSNLQRIQRDIQWHHHRSLSHISFLSGCFAFRASSRIIDKTKLSIEQMTIITAIGSFISFLIIAKVSITMINNKWTLNENKENDKLIGRKLSKV